jgi:4-hydroxy-tetrahydrodipicolinate reductase
VVGTSGWNESEVEGIKSQVTGQSVLIIPNFSISAVLMQVFSKVAASYFTDYEIIEYHHKTKADKPSGTAIATAEMINQNASINEPDEIHAVRLPGYVASQTVIFANQYEHLEIRQNSLSRESFMSGVIKAVEYANDDKNAGVIYGLADVLEIGNVG